MNAFNLEIKPLVAGIALSAAVVLSSGIAGAQDAQKLDDESLLKQRVPELNDSVMSTTSDTFMRCMVDTPSYDQWGSPRCFSTGTATYATAFFRVENAPSDFTILWSDSRCDSSKVQCSVPIRVNTSITMEATVLDNSNNTFVEVWAKAEYIGEF